MNSTPVSLRLTGAIDWSDRKDDTSLFDSATGKEQGVNNSQPEAIAAWVERLRQRFGGQRVAICLKQKHGPMICHVIRIPATSS